MEKGNTYQFSFEKLEVWQLGENWQLKFIRLLNLSLQKKNTHWCRK